MAVRRGLDVAVILSGGASSRMGRPKALLRAGECTFLQRLVDTFHAGGCPVVTVVAGRHVAEIAEALPAGALLAANPSWEKGQFSSARVGLSAALAMNASRVLVHPVDQPLLQPADVQGLLAAIGRTRPAVACHLGEPGHPLGLPRSGARALLAAPETLTLRDALARTCPEPRFVEAGPGCVRGANTPEELEAMLARFRGR